MLTTKDLIEAFEHGVEKGRLSVESACSQEAKSGSSEAQSARRSQEARGYAVVVPFRTPESATAAMEQIKKFMRYECHVVPSKNVTEDK